MTTDAGTAVAPPPSAADAPPPDAPTQPLIATDQPDAFEQAAPTDQPDGGQTTETDTSETPPQPPAKPTLAELGLTDEDLEADPAIQSILARREEGVRQRSERVALAQAAAARSQWVASGQAADQLRNLALQAATAFDDNGQPTLQREQVEAVTGDILSSGAGHAVSVFGSVLGDDLPEGFTLTNEEQTALEAARAQVDRNPLNPEPLTREWLRVRDRARDATLEAAMLERVERTAAQRTQARAAEETARQTREQMRGAPGPTNINGTPPGRSYDLSTLEGIGAALSTGWEPSEDEFAEAYRRVSSG